MQLNNTTKLVAGFTVATDKAGRERIVVVAKGSYDLPKFADHAPTLLKEQRPLVATDVFEAEPECSAVIYENDFAPFKPRCDVLFNGTCYAPGSQTATSIKVELRLGAMVKAFRVVGPRVYRTGALTWRIEGPQPFMRLPIGYGQAFGGIDRSDTERPQWYASNPAGRGFYPRASASSHFDGKPLPYTEELDRPVVIPDGKYRPMSFGVVGRGWPQRVQWAGTYDKTWLDEQFPFLPSNFDERYFQSAADDQQIDYPRGGENVVLSNLTQDGRRVFRLPHDLALPVLFLRRDDTVCEMPAVVDTVLIEPDDGRFILVWRASMPLRRNIREVTQVRLGQSARLFELEQARASRLRGKRHFGSINELAGASRSALDDTDSLGETERSS